MLSMSAEPLIGFTTGLATDKGVATDAGSLAAASAVKPPNPTMTHAQTTCLNSARMYHLC